MKIQGSKRRAHVSVNARSTGAGLVIQQGQNLVLLSPDEWEELKTVGDRFIAEQKPRKRCLMI